jgi:hypothetical protein
MLFSRKRQIQDSNAGENASLFFYLPEDAFGEFD